MQVLVNDVNLYFEVLGADLELLDGEAKERPTILLLHGGPGLDHTVFRPAFEPLTEHAQLVMYDHRGSGRSEDGPKEKWTIDQWADDVAGVIKALGLKKPIVLGTSFGGFVAQRFAAKYPDYLSGLVLMSTAPKTRINLTLEKLLLVGGLEASSAASEFFSDANRPGVVEHYFETCLQHYTFGELDIDAINRIPPRNEVMMHFFSSNGEMYRCDFSKDLAIIQVPTLVVHGEEDVIFPIELAEETITLLSKKNETGLRKPANRLVKLTNCGHLSEQDAPDIIMSEIVNFFSLNSKK